MEMPHRGESELLKIQKKYIFLRKCGQNRCHQVISLPRTIGSFSSSGPCNETVRIKFSKVSTQVASHTKGFPFFQDKTVIPSGLRPNSI